MELSKALELVAQGWIPRVRTTKKGSRIITLRKGNQERSLGSYDQRIWEQLNQKRSQLGSQIPSPRDQIELVLQILERIKQGIPLVDIAIQLRCDPELVLATYRKYLELCEQSTESPISKKLKELESRIQWLEDQEIPEIWKELGWIHESAAIRVGSNGWRCMHLREDGYCGYWWWDFEMPDWIMKQEKIVEAGEQKIVYRLKVSDPPQMYFCVGCPEYRPREQ